MRYVTLVPAFHRDYKSKKEVLQDWNEGADFIIQDMMHPDNGRYINKADAERHSKGVTFNIRYKQLREICVVKM